MSKTVCVSFGSYVAKARSIQNDSKIYNFFSFSNSQQHKKQTIINNGKIIWMTKDEEWGVSDVMGR